MATLPAPTARAEQTGQPAHGSPMKEIALPHNHCTYPPNYCSGICDVCAKHNAWGCGHSAEQRRAARRHRATRKHQTQSCECFTS